MIKDAKVKWTEKEQKLKKDIERYDQEIKSLLDRKKNETSADSKMFD